MTAHLAATLAAAGSDVIAVEADLHRPALHRLLDVEPGRTRGCAISIPGSGSLLKNFIRSR